MLYRTHHHPFLFPFNSFTSSSNNSPFPILSSPPPSLSNPQAAAEQKMDGALKSSFGPEAAVKTAQNHHNTNNDDVWAGQTGEEFSVDDLLDFSNDVVQPHFEDEQDKHPHPHEEQQKQQEGNSVIYTTDTFSVTDDFGSLTVPADDLESLEWLSHFVEDSFSGHSLTYNPAALKPKPVPEETRSEPETVVHEKSTFVTPVQTKARTKRPRGGPGGVRVWSLGSPSLTESSPTSSSSSYSSTTSFPNMSNPWAVYSAPVQRQTVESFKPPAKKKKKLGNEFGTVAQQPRRCSHCGVQKTPQWRAGPLGAKTLCNACGVRFKSGRLLPEYRPACSPTFSTELHSNNHRKVLEMRKKKEVEPDSASPVQSF